MISSPRCGVLHELLERRGCGLSYGAGDANGLAGLIATLAGARDLAASLSQSSAALFREQFTAETICAAMESHFERIAALA